MSKESNKKYLKLILFIIITTVITTLFKSGFFTNKKNENSSTFNEKLDTGDYFYKDNLLELLLPNKPEMDSTEIRKYDITLHYKIIKINNQNVDINVSSVAYPEEVGSLGFDHLNATLESTMENYNYSLRSKKDTLISDYPALYSVMESGDEIIEIILVVKNNNLILEQFKYPNEIVMSEMKKYFWSLKL
jgi:hypothetical protein